MANELKSEQSFFGLLIKEKKLMELILNSGNIFSESECRKLWNICYDLFNKGIEINAQSIAIEGKIPEGYLNQLVLCADKRDVFEIKFDNIKFKNSHDFIGRVLNNPEIKTFKALSKALDYILNEEKYEKVNFLTLKEIHTKFLNHDPDAYFKVKTGYDFFDNHGGIGKDSLIIIGARPKTGKSSFAVDLTRKGLDNNYKILWFSMEMPDLRFESKLLSNYTDVASQTIFDKKYSADTEYNIGQILESTKNNLLFLTDKRMSIHQIIRKIRYMKKEYDIDMVFIDHLHYIKDHGQYKSQIEKLAEIVNSLAELKKELNITIYLVAQLNRETEQDNKPPRMKDLKGCGDIEQAADLILLMHESKKISAIKSNIDIIVFNRYGIGGTMYTEFEKQTSKFNQITRQESIE